MYTITFGQTTIPYEIIWSHEKKNATISVTQAKVTVIAPTNTKIDKIHEIMKNKAIWIRKQLLHFDEMINVSSQRSFVSGEKLPYLGRQYRLKVLKSSTILQPSFKFNQGVFIAELPENISEEIQREILLPLYKQWIKSKGEKLVKSRIARFTLKLQTEPTTIKIKEQQQRWGSCTAKGQVLINWRILLAPVSIIDYVIAHELAHLKYMDHSKAFWDTLGMLVSDYEERKEWLRVYGQLLYV